MAAPSTPPVKHARDEEPQSSAEKKPRSATMVGIEFKLTFVAETLQLNVEREKIPIMKPKSARAPRTGINLGIGKFKEPVYFVVENCGMLDERPIFASEQFQRDTKAGGKEAATSIAIPIRNSEAVKGIRAFDEMLLEKHLTRPGVLELCGMTTQDMRKTYKYTCDLEGITLPLPEIGSPEDRPYTIMEFPTGRALQPDNAEIAWRPVRRLVFRPMFVSAGGKGEPSVCKQLVYLELGTPVPEAQRVKKQAAPAVDWRTPELAGDTPPCAQTVTINDAVDDDDE